MGNEKDLLIEHLGMLLSSGMDVLSAFSVLEEDMRSRKLKRIVREMRTGIERGAGLADVFEETGLFEPYTISLIRNGEDAGRLEENLKLIADQQQKTRLFRSKIRSALIYPLFVFGITVVAALGVTWFILPRLSRVFAQLQIDLPFVTRVLIWVGEVVREHGLWLIPSIFAACALTVYLVFFFRYTKIVGQWILFHIPGINTIIEHVEVARFSYLVGSLVQAGIPITEALHSAANASTFYAYGRFFHHVSDEITAGRSFREAFEDLDATDRVFSRTIQRMITTAERSGTLDETTLHISEVYQEKMDSLTKNLTVVLEPALLVVVWLAVVGVAVAVIMPIYDLVGGLNQNL